MTSTASGEGGPPAARRRAGRASPARTASSRAGGHRRRRTAFPMRPIPTRALASSGPCRRRPSATATTRTRGRPTAPSERRARQAGDLRRHHRPISSTIRPLWPADVPAIRSRYSRDPLLDVPPDAGSTRRRRRSRWTSTRTRPSSVDADAVVTAHPSGRACARRPPQRRIGRVAREDVRCDLGRTARLDSTRDGHSDGPVSARSTSSVASGRAKKRNGNERRAEARRDVHHRPVWR